MRVGTVRNPERVQWGKPLEGVRVLAIEQMQALPYATQLMMHLGADVVKLEPPGRGESGRASRPQIRDADGREVGATYLRNNLGKASIAIDLRDRQGRDLLHRLLPHFDVVAENLRPEAAARMGLGWETVSQVSPSSIYVTISGFGHDPRSPYFAWPAYAPVVEAMAGLYEPNRPEGQPPPVVVAGALGDNSSALFAVIGMQAALRQRDRTGRGQHVDISMFDSMVALTDLVPFMHSLGAPPSAATAGNTGLVGAFRARDGYFVVAIFREHQFERLVHTIGTPEWLDDPRFATREGWARSLESVVRPAMEAWAASLGKQQAASQLCAQGIPAGPSNRAEDVVGDAHVALHDMLVEVPRPDGGAPMQIVGNPVKLSDVAEGPVASFPGLGADTDRLLGEVLALDASELAALRSRGIIE